MCLLFCTLDEDVPFSALGGLTQGLSLDRILKQSLSQSPIIADIRVRDASACNKREPNVPVFPPIVAVFWKYDEKTPFASNPTW